MLWQTTHHRIDLTVPKVMGIVNTTPDSFSDGGQFADAKAAIDHCRRLIDAGADILDIGGESSRPGAVSVPLDEERRRVLPVLEAVLSMGHPVSIDTVKPDLMAEAVSLGVDIVNDINALRLPGALDVVAAHPTCGVCLMHMQGEPSSMQSQARYADVVADVRFMLEERLAALTARGVAAERIVLDPGIGFGKTVEHNVELLRRQQELLALGRPLLVGWSRKSTLGALTGRAVGDRLAASLAAALAALAQGASVLRVHDVAATVDALKVWRAAGLPITPATVDELQ
ncbi:MAG: dihydropteroate synthase [Burkholderiales bacterium PBB1]|nr:MAG: dihydropteroate synthase [Burkholderiales bacterium PBB1]